MKLYEVEIKLTISCSFAFTKITMNWCFWRKAKKALKRDCLCEALKPMLKLTRQFFLSPIKWKHLEEQLVPIDVELCHFELSSWHVFYSILNFAGSIHEFTQLTFDYDDIEELLSMVNQIIYAILSSGLVCYGVFRARNLSRTLNGIVKLIQSGVMCKSSQMYLKRKIKIGSNLVYFQFILQIIGFFFILYFNIFMDIRMDKYNDIFMRNCVSMSHSVFILFYYLTCAISLIYMHLFICFESTLIQRISEFSNSPAVVLGNNVN